MSLCQPVFMRRLPNARPCSRGGVPWYEMKSPRLKGTVNTQVDRFSYDDECCEEDRIKWVCGSLRRGLCSCEGLGEASPRRWP